jgi:hypothetical protein
MALQRLVFGGKLHAVLALSAGMLALVMFTSATIGARSSNTRAVLSQMNRRRMGEQAWGVVRGTSAAGDGSQQLRLSYKGPMYVGDGEWSDSTGAAISGHERAQRKQQHQQLTGGGGGGSGVEGGDVTAVGDEHKGWAAARAAGLAFPPPAARSRDMVKKKGPNMVGKIMGSVSRAAREAEGTLAEGIKPVGQLLEKGRKLGGEISEGFSKALDVSDVRVSPRRPVKMLTHV